MSGGFEIETEMTIHALDKNFLIEEVPVAYRDRVEGSNSKLSTFRDGFLIFFTIVVLLKDYRPLLFFSVPFASCAALGVLSGVPVLFGIGGHGGVSRVSLAAFSVFMIFLAFQFLSVGFILDTMARNRRAQQDLWKRSTGKTTF
jgi:hypothetical protein